MRKLCVDWDVTTSILSQCSVRKIENIFERAANHPITKRSQVWRICSQIHASTCGLQKASLNLATNILKRSANKATCSYRDRTHQLANSYGIEGFAPSCNPVVEPLTYTDNLHIYFGRSNVYVENNVLWRKQRDLNGSPWMLHFKSVKMTHSKMCLCDSNLDYKQRKNRRFFIKH